MAELHYLDNNATTRPAPEVVEAMMPFFTERWGNASSMYEFGGRVHADMEASRAKVAALLGCDAGEVVFPRVGQKVEVRVDRAGVQAAAADAQRTVIRRIAVDERVGVLNRVLIT